MDEEREMVLRMLKEGKISVEEADALLQELADQPPGVEGSAAGRPHEAERQSTGGRVASKIGADLRQELHGVFKELMESIPKDLRRELHRTREAFTPSFVDVVRGLRGLAEGRAETTAEEPMRAGETLILRQAWGDVRLRADGEGPMRLRALRRVWSTTPEQAQREAEALPVEVRRDGATVVVHVPRPEGRRARVDFEITVPKGVGARIDVAKGDVRAEGIAATDLHLARGDVHIAGLDGALRADVVSGDVDIRGVEGDVRLDVRSGDVAAQDVRSSDLRVRTLSGDVAVDLVELAQGTVSVETVSGDIMLSVPSDGRATIEASTRTGQISTGLPLAEQTTGFRSLRGVLNGPGASVRLQATSGDVRVRGR